MRCQVVERSTAAGARSVDGSVADPIASRRLRWLWLGGVDVRSAFAGKVVVYLPPFFSNGFRLQTFTVLSALAVTKNSSLAAKQRMGPR